MEQKKICEVCKDLELFDDEIFIESLLQSAANGCQSCAMLKDGVSNFVEDFKQVNRLQLVLDISLFIYALGTNSETVGVFEFYTLPGMRSVIA